MKTYKATFQNGDSYTRKTDRNYSHAWRIQKADGTWWDEAKFAGSKELADKAAKSHLRMDSENWVAYEVTEATEA